MRYSIILFDADDTIFDFHRACHYALDVTFPKYGLPNTPESHETYMRINQNAWNEFEQGILTKEELKYQRFRRLLDFWEREGDAVQMSEDYMDALGEGAFLIDGAMETCRVLSQERRLYFVTNGVERVQRSRLSHSPIREFFTDIFVSEAVGIPKPHREYFDFVFSHIPDFNLEKAIIVGDSLTSDMAGGVTAGLDTCWYNPKGLPKPENLQLTYEIRRLPELLDIL